MCGMGYKRKLAGAGQTDVIRDGLDDGDLADAYDEMMGRREEYRCELCKHPITADESRAFGVGTDCAADIGRMMWRRMSDEQRLELQAGRRTEGGYPAIVGAQVTPLR